ncbi:MAG: DoxX family protein [Terriglobales bacterium]
MKATLIQGQQAFGRTANVLQSPLLLAIRAYWGWQFIQTGWGKIHNLGHVVQFFTSLGIPLPGVNAFFVSWLELLGGLLLIVGLLSRPVALMLAIDMVVAFLAADRDALRSIISEPDKFYAAAPYTFLFASLIILAFGPGRIALDTWIEHRMTQSG